MEDAIVLVLLFGGFVIGLVWALVLMFSWSNAYFKFPDFYWPVLSAIGFPFLGWIVSMFVLLPADPILVVTVSISSLILLVLGFFQRGPAPAATPKMFVGTVLSSLAANYGFFQWSEYGIIGGLAGAG